MVEAALEACIEIFKKMPNVIRKCSEEISALIHSKEKLNHYKALVLYS